MKKNIIKLLRKLKLYHPLQTFYRSCLFKIHRFFVRVQYKKYKGAGFLCNVCGSTYSKFKDDFPTAENHEAINANKVIAGYGRNIFCPFCLSNARERLVLLMLKEHADWTGKTVLHLSPEKNVFQFVTEHAQVTTADIQPGFYQHISADVEYQDANQLTYGDNSFQLVIGNHILEHIPDDVAALREIFRVLKPGGRAILQVPYSDQLVNTIEQPNIDDPVLQSRLYGQKDHVRIYARKNYMERLMSAGFEVRFISYEQLSSLLQYAIQENEGFFDIRKPIT